MAEITSRDNVLIKLREFDEYMAGAISAAKTLIRSKTESEQIQETIQKTRQDSDAIRMQLNNILSEWQKMKADVMKTLDDDRKTRQQALKELDGARISIGHRLSTAEERLQMKNAEVLLEHMRLETSSREYAEKVISVRDSVMEQAHQLEHLLSSIREDLYAKIQDEYVKAKELIKNDFRDKQQAVFRDFGEQSDKLSRGLQDNMSALQQEVKKDVLEHKQGIERHLTEFLSKQNILVQNLSQQIDGYSRSSQTLLTEQNQLQQKMQALEDYVKKSSLELQQSTQRQDTENGKIKSEVKKISVRLEQTISLLKTTISGRTFKDL